MSWGKGFADFDNNRWPDIAVVTGSVYIRRWKRSSRTIPSSRHGLFRNLGDGVSRSLWIRSDRVSAQPISFARDQETRHSWIAVEPSMLPVSLRRELERHHGPAPFMGKLATLLDAARQSLTPLPEGELLHDNAYEALATAILCSFALSVLEGSRAVQPSASLLLRMERFIAEAYARPITLNDIARAAGASRQHLLKLCRFSGKRTPTEQPYAKRLEVAVDLLLHTGFPIVHIAEQCGFSNQFHFSRKFKQATGRSPSSWRGQAWKQRS